MIWDRLWLNAHLATMRPGSMAYGAIENGAIAVRGGRIAWLGPMAALPHRNAVLVEDLAGAWVTPGLIDCHTHLVFGGNRANEFELRLQGVAYAEIARRGGGIRSTVAATRAASEEELLAAAAQRLAALQRGGVTTVEIKSGYGLEPETELRMLRVARTLGRRPDIDVVTSFLGLHAVPAEYAGDSSGYLDLVKGPMLQAVIREGLADAVDAFCETIAFSSEEVAALFAAAKALGLPVKLHADQLGDLGGAALAARFGALSADHLEHTSEDGVRAMAEAGTVAVLLPGAYYMLRETRRPPVELLRAHGVPMAVATDANPGTSPLLSPLLALNMACVLFGLTPEEALAGMTRVAARALGLADRGVLEVGALADLAVWRIGQPAELCYWLGLDPLERLFKAGAPVGTVGAAATAPLP
ncbi:imidazolonepropionase [Benzoatithermus flavus]|uniref:Imidazolonepropionase n=1 Tax=Benzoatithermus flavus TaxID=3108223 RepID=A0ABU8XN73_9PROT